MGVFFVIHAVPYNRVTYNLCQTASVCLRQLVSLNGNTNTFDYALSPRGTLAWRRRQRGITGLGPKRGIPTLQGRTSR